MAAPRARKISKRQQRDRASLRRIFEDKKHLGERLPDLITPPPETLASLVQEAPAVPSDSTRAQTGPTAPDQPVLDRESGPRKVKWELLLHSAQQYGFTHPKQCGFLMLPAEYYALLALEKKAVAQIVLEVMRQTIGWDDPSGPHGRREWAKLGHKHFERICGSSSQAFTGLKTGLQKGYIKRRPCKGGFEYAIRWHEDDTSRAEAL